MAPASGSGRVKGYGGQGYGWDTGIQLRASGGLSRSSPTIISDNIVADNFNGIIIQSPSPNACRTKLLDEGRYGPCEVRM